MTSINDRRKTSKNIRLQAKSIAFTTIMAIVLVLMPGTTLVGAVQESPQQPTMKSFSERLPVAAAQLHSYARDQVAHHPGWVASISWNATNAKITYLGPVENDPNMVTDPKILAAATMGPVRPQGFQANSGISPLIVVNTPVLQEDGIIKDTTSSSTAEMEEDATFNLKQSAVSSVDNYQVLNALSSQNNNWFQVSPVYDVSGDLGHPGSWTVVYNKWTTTTSTTPIAIVNTVSFANGAQVQSSIQADPFNAGVYTLAVAETGSPFAGNSLVWSLSGDPNHNINLGHVDNSIGYFESGAMVEEHTQSSTAKYNFGTEPYTYTFFDSLGSGATTSVTGFYGPPPPGVCATVSTQNIPAQDSFTFSC